MLGPAAEEVLHLVESCLKDSRAYRGTPSESKVRDSMSRLPTGTLIALLRHKKSTRESNTEEASRATTTPTSAIL